MKTPDKAVGLTSYAPLGPCHLQSFVCLHAWPCTFSRTSLRSVHACPTVALVFPFLSCTCQIRSPCRSVVPHALVCALGKSAGGCPISRLGAHPVSAQCTAHWTHSTWDPPAAHQSWAALGCRRWFRPRLYAGIRARAPLGPGVGSLPCGGPAQEGFCAVFCLLMPHLHIM